MTGNEDSCICHKTFKKQNACTVTVNMKSEAKEASSYCFGIVVFAK